LEILIEKAIPLADYYFSWLEQRFGMSLNGKSQIASEVSRLLAKISNPFEVDLLVRRAVDSLGIREELLRRRPLVSLGHSLKSRQTVKAFPETVSQSRDDIADRSLVILMLRFPAVLRSVAQDPEVRLWLASKWQEVVDAILAEWQERGRVDGLHIAEKFAADRASEIAALVLEGERIAEAEYERMAANCLSHLRRKHLRGLKQTLRIAIRAAEEQKDEKAKRERILEWQDVVQKERLLEHQRFELKTTSR
jgi:DNA primase